MQACKARCPGIRAGHQAALGIPRIAPRVNVMAPRVIVNRAAGHRHGAAGHRGGAGGHRQPRLSSRGRDRISLPDASGVRATVVTVIVEQQSDFGRDRGFGGPGSLPGRPIGQLYERLVDADHTSTPCAARGRAGRRIGLSSHQHGRWCARPGFATSVNSHKREGKNRICMGSGPRNNRT